MQNKMSNIEAADHIRDLLALSFDAEWLDKSERERITVALETAVAVLESTDEEDDT